MKVSYSLFFCLFTRNLRSIVFVDGVGPFSLFLKLRGGFKFHEECATSRDIIASNLFTFLQVELNHTQMSRAMISCWLYVYVLRFWNSGRKYGRS